MRKLSFKQSQNSPSDPNAGKSPQKSGSSTGDFKKLLDKAWDIFAILSLPIGMALAYLFPTLAIYMEQAFSIFIEALVKIVPFVVPVILPPVIIETLRKGKAGKMFLPAIFLGIILMTFLAAIYSSFFLTVFFDLPLTGGGAEISLGSVLDVLKNIPFFSLFFISIYITFAFIVVSYFSDKLKDFLSDSYTVLQKGFEFFDIVAPVLMFLAGGYLLRFQLPEIEKIPVSLPFVSKVTTVNFYIYSIVLTVVITFSFLLLLIIIIRAWRGRFRIKNFLKYTARIFPISWLTSSEIVSIPVSLRWSKKYLRVKRTVRKTVIPIVGVLQSTEIALVLPIYGILAAIAVGVEVSFLSLLIYSFTIFIIFDFVVVGVPSEVAILALPLSQAFPIPEPKVHAFIGLVVVLQAGISDSFRTSANVTFGGLYSVFMEDVYHKLRRGYDKREVEKET